MTTGDLDYYSILGLTRDASSEEIRSAYFESARIYHPDANPTPNARERFLVIQKAYEILSSPERRGSYDASLPAPASVSAISMNVMYSRNAVVSMSEPQLIYSLVELICTASPEVDRVTPVHICLVLDCSTSMKGERLDMVKASAIQLLRRLKAQDMISIVTFNDRAEVVIPTTRVVDLPRLEQKISLLDTAGGTEIFSGLEAGLGQLQVRGSFSSSMFRQLILLTDGHTYGDEEKCYLLAKSAERDGIVINAIGIGDEWNDAFLDRMSSLSGGNAVMVTSPKGIGKILDQRLDIVSSVYARGLNFEFKSDANVQMRYAFRLNPDTSPLETESPLSLGNLHYGKSISVLLEFYIPSLSMKMGRLKLADGAIQLQIPTQKGNNVLSLVIDRPIVREIEVEPPPAAIVEAMSRLTLYRMQERARLEVKNGNISEATKHLQYLATHLLSNGNRELAHTVLVEAEHIKQSKRFSNVGDKRIKYGTRALLLPAGTESKNL